MKSYFLVEDEAHLHRKIRSKLIDGQAQRDLVLRRALDNTSVHAACNPPPTGKSHQMNATTMFSGRFTRAELGVLPLRVKSLGPRICGKESNNAARDKKKGKKNHGRVAKEVEE
jgi:hypothetical protein